ncbi:jg12015 [Pararge aegeria aegeria]|uniref:Jg12015 protein n=1 Tax=Pararge aegeria aegeria TaxID=348720 RepID=A0A8S4R882_9NEOP|nr:jg12015 [Pararge aegeria aegeria]
MDRKEQLKFFCMVLSMATLVEYSFGMFTLPSWSLKREKKAKPVYKQPHNTKYNGGTAESETVGLAKEDINTNGLNSETEVAELTPGPITVGLSSEVKYSGQPGGSLRLNKPGLNSVQVFELFSQES